MYSFFLWSTIWVKHKRGGSAFWDAEYSKGGHLALSTNPSEDLEKFTRWLEREDGRAHLNITASVLDLGCGNGRNLFWLASQYGVRGIGYDSSSAAIAQAKTHAKNHGLKLTYETRSIAGALEVPDASQAIVLDMMTSHFLNESARRALIEEIHRVLAPGGYFFYKTFLLDGDSHAKRMIAEKPAQEVNTYIHPSINVAEHVSTEEEIDDLYSPFFTIHKIYKSHRHTGKHAKRRSVVVYMQKSEF